VPNAEHTIGGGMKFGGQSSGVEMSGGPTEPTSASTTTAEQVLVGESSVVAFQAVAAAKRSEAVQACGGGLKFGGQNRGMGASCGPTEPTAASTETEELFLFGASSVVAVQAAAAAKGSEAGGGGFAGEDVTKAKRPGIPQQEKCIVGVAPGEESEKDSASGAKHDAPGAGHTIGGGMKFGGQSSVVGASGSPTEPTSASTTTAEQVLVGASSVVAI
jgi:hypothetical protein